MELNSRLEALHQALQKLSGSLQRGTRRIGIDQMSEKSRNNRNEEYLSIIREAVSEVQYGTVTVNIQDGVIVQVEKSERYRLKNSSSDEPAGGRRV